MSITIFDPLSMWRPLDSCAAAFDCDGERMRTVRELVSHLRERLRLPDYARPNWDSIAECLGDLDWIPAGHIVIRIDSADLVLSRATHRDRRIWLDVLIDMCEESAPDIHECWMRATSLEASESLKSDLADAEQRRGEF